MRRTAAVISILIVASTALCASEKAKGRAPCYFGDLYPSCTLAERSAWAQALARAKTAAVIIEATQTIACGDGSDGCFRTDGGAVTIIQREIEESGLWENLTKVEAKKANILLKFNTTNRAALTLSVYDADSNALLWRDIRSPSIALDNDSAKEINHFLVTLKSLSNSRTPLPLPEFLDDTQRPAAH